VQASERRLSGGGAVPWHAVTLALRRVCCACAAFCTQVPSEKVKASKRAKAGVVKLTKSQ
jgi:hypothetical protein